MVQIRLIPRKRAARLIIGSLVLIIVLIGALEMLNVTHIFGSDKPQTASQYTKGEPSSADNADSSGPDGNTSSAQNGADNPKTGGSTTATLLSPSGEFVSNHHPNLSGSPAPNHLSSVCNTTPGATCQILFTKGSTVKKLDSKVTDGGGAAYWDNWRLQDVGLTAGSWDVEAIATLNGQTKTTADSLALEVKE